MPISISDLSPVRQKLKAFVTPDVADYIVSETVDTSKREIPEFGTPHPNDKNYPNHIFCFAQPTSDEQGLLYRFFYAAPRADQDEYNWEHTVADIGGNKFSAVTRTYVNLRDGYVPLTPTMGTAMPDAPAGLFTEEFILASREEKRIGDRELDSVFIVEQLTYVKRVTITEVTVRSKTGKGDIDTTTLYYRGEVLPGGSTTIEDAVASGSWDADADGTYSNVNQLSENWYAITTRTFLDTDTSYRRTSSKLRPSQFFCPQATSTDTVTTVSTGVPSTATAGDQQEVVVEKVGLVQTVSTTTQSGTPSTLVGTDLDERTGTTFTVTQESVLKSAVAPSTVTSGGQLVTYRAVDACQAIKETRTVASTEIREWDKIVNYEWPPVLTNYAFTFWTQVGGRQIALPDFTFKQGFSGPQVAHVRQWWQLESPTVTSPNQMIPEGAKFNTPLVDFSIPPCLHGDIVARCVIGIGDPDWFAADYTKTFAATNFTDWPDSIVWTESDPYNGGYIVTEYTLNKPE